MSKITEFLKDFTDKTPARQKSFKAGVYEVVPVAKELSLSAIKSKVDVSVIPVDPEVVNSDCVCRYYVVNRAAGKYVGEIVLTSHDNKRRTAKVTLGEWVQNEADKDLIELMLQMVSWSYDNVLVSLFVMPVAEQDLRLLKILERAKFTRWNKHPELLLNNQYARGLMSSIVAGADW